MKNRLCDITIMNNTTLQAKTLVTAGPCEQEKKNIPWSEELKYRSDASLILMKIYLRAAVLLLLHLLQVGGLHSGMRVSGLRGTIFAWRNQVRKWSYSWMRKWLNGLMDGWLDRWTDGRMNGQMAGWRDWWIYVRMETCIHANILWFHFSLQHL